MRLYSETAARRISPTRLNVQCSNSKIRFRFFSIFSSRVFGIDDDVGLLLDQRCLVRLDHVPLLVPGR